MYKFSFAVCHKRDSKSLFCFVGIRNTTQGFRNLSSTVKESEIQYLKSGIHGMDSRIQDCVGFPSACQRRWVPFHRLKLGVTAIDFFLFCSQSMQQRSLQEWREVSRSCRRQLLMQMCSRISRRYLRGRSVKIYRVELIRV